MAEAATVPQGEAPGPDAARLASPASTRRWPRSRSPDLLVYVHGANTTVERAAGQAAQLRHFTGRDAVVILYAWPTAENFLRYPRDIETAFGGAPHLAEFLSLLAGHTAARAIGVFTYSAGATIGSDALALLAREAPDAAARLGEIYHAAPDADFRGFVDDLGVYAPAARRVTTAVNLGDSALRLAATVNRASRAGRPDLPNSTPTPPPGCSPPPTTTSSRSSRSAPTPCPTCRHLAHLLVRRPLGLQRRARSPCCSTSARRARPRPRRGRLRHPLLDLPGRLPGPHPRAAGHAARTPARPAALTAARRTGNSGALRRAGSSAGARTRAGRGAPRSPVALHRDATAPRTRLARPPCGGRTRPDQSPA